MVVGTHALIEPDVEFARLAVCVVDEQHRFGVRQRAALDAKGPGGAAPHALHMTATPIPRTLSLTAYGDLDATVLRELPGGAQAGRDLGGGGGEARRRLRVHPRAAARGPPGVRRLPAGRGLGEARGEGRGRGGRAAARRRVRATSRSGSCTARCRRATSRRRWSGSPPGRTDVLVATSVIEVGIDVANATVMLVEGAERYGLSQLHQLRGRVGRGEHASHCILFARRRLRARPPAAGGDRDRARRLQARRGRPGAARRGRDPRHPPARPAALPGRRASRGRRRS